MSFSSSPSVLLSNLAQAEKEMAFYAAIIGHKPRMIRREATPEPVAAKEPEVAEPMAPEPISESPRPRRMSVWMHHISDQARRRIHEAKMRLAS
jgi:hypothetical protein